MDENKPMPTCLSVKLQLCVKEIEIIQATIARYDNNGSNIKSWCVTTWSAISAYAISERESAIALLGLAIIVGFGLVELTYRRFQKRFINRAAEIEQLLKSDQLTNYAFSIHKTGETRSDKEFRSVLLLPHFVLFYVALGIFSLAISFYCWRYPNPHASFFLKLSSLATLSNRSRS